MTPRACTLFDLQTPRKGDKVVLWFQAANRDPAVFPDPESLRIDREENDHLGFGWGIHACMGSHLARAEVSTFFGKLLERGLRIRPLAAPHQPVRRVQAAPCPHREGGHPVKVIVDWDLCVGHGQCEFAAPEVFTINDGGDLDVLDETPAESERRNVEQAVRRCPTRALAIAD